MQLKKVMAFVLSCVMIISAIPAGIGVYAASTQGIIDSLGGSVLWSAPDGSFYDTAVADAFDGWTSQITRGYANVRTYDEGTTIQYYVNSTDNITTITSPGYGADAEKIVIEWTMKRQSADELHFDFSFKDIEGTEISYLKFDNGQTTSSADYVMGFPESGTDCAIVAYNNADGTTHTSEYYVAGEKAWEETELEGAISGFKSIESSNGTGNTAWAHVGFANLTIGSCEASDTKVTVVATYTLNGQTVATAMGTYDKADGETSYTFPKKNVYYNEDVWYADETALSESGNVELVKYDRYKTKNAGDTFELDGTEYKVTGDSAIVNGNFITGDTLAWTNRQGTAITDATVSYSEAIGGNIISLSAGGKDATNNIGTEWSVTQGQSYYLSFWAGGDKPDSNNYTYNQLFQSDKSTSAFAFGANMTEGAWVRFEKIIVPTGDTFYFQCSWTGVITFGNFELLPIEVYTGEEETTEEPTEEVTEEPTEEVTEEVTEEPTQYSIAEDAFVQNNVLYGINTTNSNGVMVASVDDENRGPQYDANGETTYLDGATPTTLGSSRVGLMKFEVPQTEEDEEVLLNFYVRSWHSQGFDGGNTFLKIAVTPLADSSWADQRERSSFTIASEPLLDTWATPVFTDKLSNTTGYVTVDVTEIIHAAQLKNMDYISFKLQIYWGAAYIVEREAAVTGGSYEGKGSYLSVEENRNLSYITTSGDATLTKNGAIMNGFAFVTEDDDVRLLLDGAYAIAADSGYYFPNETMSITEKVNMTNTYAMKFGLTMVDGAQVRFGGGVDSEGKVNANNGLRFITTVNRSDTLAGILDAEMGVIIKAEGSDEEVKIVAEKWQNETTFTTALTNLSVSNYNRKFTAYPYVTIDGKTFVGEGVTRSIYQVAAGLLVNGSTDNTEYEDGAMKSELLYKVLNAYVNQVGIRLTFSDNESFTDWELTVRTDGNGSYSGDAYFIVSETTSVGKVYYVTLIPVGENTVILNYWNTYIRINNNNSLIKLYTELEDNGDGTYTLSFDVTDLNLGLTPSEKFEAMKPTYDRAVSAIRSANDYWQNNYSYNTWTSGIHPAFWSRAAYHTGNIEVYKLLGDEDYLQHSVDWANYCEWMGNNNTTADPSEWTYGYNQTQGSNAVLFGDWQICFQSYIDMYNFGVEGASIDRVKYVIDYQISTDNDDYWWWADSLYMVMPVMTKLYKLTGDEAYLEALTKYFTFAKELMYDGPGGIPESSDGYTSTAYTYKNSGSNYSDPDNYAYLFFRDAGYVYPLNPNTGHEDEKNFWSRGNGWVFAGLAKVLADMPEDYEHYADFYNTYMEMASAIIACQQIDSDGYGFWTQSMLQDYPKGTNDNDEGYETSGTAFFVYGLFWGINNGFLDEETYLNAAVRGWGYLENVALQDDGLVGYVQPIGSNATQATPATTTQDFGVGAYLLACCEAARWAEAQ